MSAPSGILVVRTIRSEKLKDWKIFSVLPSGRRMNASPDGKFVLHGRQEAHNLGDTCYSGLAILN